MLCVRYMHVCMHDAHERVFCVYDVYVLVCVWGACIYGCVCIFVYVCMWCMCVWVCLCVSVVYMDDVCVCMLCDTAYMIGGQLSVILYFLCFIETGTTQSISMLHCLHFSSWKSITLRLQSPCCFTIFWICLLSSILPYLKFRPLPRLLWKLIER